MFDEDAYLRPLLGELTPSARDDLRRVLIRYLDDRDAIAFRLMRYRDEAGNYGGHDRLLKM